MDHVHPYLHGTWLKRNIVTANNYQLSGCMLDLEYRSYKINIIIFETTGAEPTSAESLSAQPTGHGRGNAGS